MRFRKWALSVCGVILAGALFLASVHAAEVERIPQHPHTSLVISGTLEANSNRQVHPFSTEPVESLFTIEGFELVGETEELGIYLNRQDGALRTMNKRTGYLWGALPLEKAEGLNSTWRSYGNSLVAVECYNGEGIESRLGIGKDGAIQYEILDDCLICSVNYANVGISMQVKVSWSGNQLTVELVNGSLIEGAGESVYKIKSMTFLPFLGSSYSDSIDGYILIPDGSGGLIRYRQPANYTSTYSARIYGRDLGIDSQSSDKSNIHPEQQILMPIYGMVHGAYQNGFLAVVEEGAEYASILGTPAQTNIPYNWAAARFEYRQKYVKNINRKQGAGALIPQEMANDIVPKVTFYFLDGAVANYDGMAVMYRQLLIDSGVLTPSERDVVSVPLQVELLGADKKRNFLWNTTEVFTTVEQAKEIVSSLNGLGLSNLDLVWRCYTKNNESGAKLLAALGNQSEFDQLEQLVSAAGGNVYYYLNPVTANEDQITLRTEAANNLSRMAISWSDSNATIYPTTYLYRLTEVSSRLKKAKEREYGGTVALAEITNRLYGDFTSGKEKTRSESLDEIIAMVGDITGGEKTAMYQPNQYLWQYGDKLFSLPICNSQFLYESDSVPFLQIVLSGCAEMYGTSINTTSCSTERLLRLVEYGMAPAFTLTGCESEDLYLTAQQSCFSTNYRDWEPQLLEAYQMVSEGLAEVWGHSIVSHTCIENGLIRVEYDNGVRIYINYTDKPLNTNGLEVEAGWFRVCRG